MSQPSRPRGQGPAKRRGRDTRLDSVTPLEERKLLAPIVSVFPRSVTLGTAVTVGTTTSVPVTVTTATTSAYPATLTGTATNALGALPSAAAITSVSQLTPITSFGGDIVRIEAGPGGEFGKGVYAISRGAGDNSAFAINRPGVIYRVDPATGKSSVFFDLNTVIPQLDSTQTSAANSAGTGTGLVNWYDITFDNEGIFDGRPSMFVSSVDYSNAAKNAIYRIASDGTFLGAYTTYSDTTLSQTKLTFNPTAILVPPVEQQNFLRGLLAGTGSGSLTVANTTGANFAGLFFDSNQFRDGTPLNSLTLPKGVKQTGFVYGPQTSITAANTNYSSQVFDTFADFGVPNFPVDSGDPFPATPGLSGVEGLNGEFLINLGVSPNQTAGTIASNIDLYPSISTNYRRFQDSAFDHYGYFSQGLPVGGTSGTGNNATSERGINFGGTVYAGSMFVADLASGLAITQSVTVNGTATPVLIPIQGSGTASTTVNADGTISITTPTGSLGGRIVRIDEYGRVSNFAENFDTSDAFDSNSFIGSSLSISFSADGTTLYAADNDGIWQFKTTASLAGSSSGSIIGLNDLRTLGVPYDGQNSAVDVIDTGVDARNTNFRGRVAPGVSTTIANGLGNDDYSSGLSVGGGNGTTGGNTGGNTGGGAGGNAGGNTGGISGGSINGHGTPVAGVIAQFVPQATINPINIFAPFAPGSTLTSTGGNNGNTNTSRLSTNQATNIDAIFSGIQYANANPYVKDPVRPLNNDRVIAASLAFGTVETFPSEVDAYKSYPQAVIAFKNQFRKMLKLGIAPIASAGQFGAPASASGVTNGNNTNTITNNRGARNVAENGNVGDVNGMSLPAVFNEVISVTGSYPFLYDANASTPPTDPATSVLSRLPGPVLVFGNTFNVAGSNVTTGTTGTGSFFGTSNGANSLGALTAAEGGVLGGTVGNNNGNNTGNTGGAAIVTFSDRILGSSNRSSTTDFAAPELDVPTFNRIYAGDGGQQNAFTLGGTSLSSAIVTGAYSLVSSALDWWSNLSKTGVTSDAYLTQPVGARTLDFGAKSIIDFKAYNNPTGINGILAYTAVPATDTNDSLSASGPTQLLGSTLYKSYARVDVGNAIAAIEGEVALTYLLKHGTFSIIDTNNNGLITSQEIQNFVDNAAGMGLPEAGAMARLLGGTARSAVDTNFTLSGEQPDQPDVLQRRYNFFDYAADGRLNGAISIKQYKMLQKTLLPTADQYTITDRQRASANGFLIAPESQRNFRNLQKLLPKYEFLPGSKFTKYKGVTPAQFGVSRGLKGLAGTGPVFSLFDASNGSNTATTTTTGTTTASTGSGTGTGSTTGSTTTGTGNDATSATTGSTTTTTASSSGSTSSTKPTTTSSLPTPIVSASTPTASTTVSTPNTGTTTTSQQQILDQLAALSGSKTKGATASTKS